MDWRESKSVGREEVRRIVEESVSGEVAEKSGL